LAAVLYRSAYIYHKTKAGIQLDELVDDFQRFGLTLPNPNNTRVTILSYRGEQIYVQPRWLNWLINESYDVNVQWWLNSATDLRSRIRFAEANAIEEYVMDGLTAQEQKSIHQALSLRLLKKTREEAIIGGYVDWSGVTEEFDWDTFFLGEAEFNLPFPDLLCVPSSKLARIKTSFAGITKQEFGAHIVLQNTQFPSLA
jgi:hypothetical protein